MLRSENSAVAYESATTLISLSTAPSAVKAATDTLIELFSNQSDNNVKMVIVSRLEVVVDHNSKLLSDSVMDLLHLLKTPNNDIRKSLLKMSTKLINPRNVLEVVTFLRNEMTAIVNEKDELFANYRGLLIRHIHTIAVKYPEVADGVVLLLLDYLNSDSGYDIMLFVREMLVKVPSMNEVIIQKIVEVFESIEKATVFKLALWILAEFCQVAIIPQVLQTIQVSRSYV